jgi:hypothetical protein
MAGLKTLLGLYPKTAVYEGKRKQLTDEYNALAEFEKSEELARYKELEQYTKSGDFASQKKYLLNLRYKDSEEFKQESEFNQLKSDSEIKLYFKTKGSALLKLYFEIHDSKKLARYHELDKFIQSSEYLTVKNFYNQSPSKRFEQSDPGKDFAEYEAKLKSDKIQGSLKFVNNKLYKDFEAIKNSEKLARYEELKKYITSSAFSSKQNSMKKQEFLASEDGALLKEFQLLSKAKDLRNYFKHINSPYFNAFKQVTESGELESFLELKNYYQSVDFKQKRQEIEKKTFKHTDEYKLLLEFNQLKNDPEIKKYLAFSKSKDLQNFNSIDKSQKLEKYNSLKVYTESQDFLEKKKYLTMSPKLRWKQSEAFSLEQEFEQIKNSQKIKWYFKYINHKKFNWFRTWQVTFEDDFDSGKLDRNKWLTRYYWGEEMLQDSYSLFNEKHCITDGKNLEFDGSSLKIITRKEEAEGKIWDLEMGFVPYYFKYTSGLINTSKSFRQLHGIFEAKIKIGDNPQVLNAFWMVGDKMLPHIDILNAQSKCGFGLISDLENKFGKTLGRNKFASDYYIYSMEWSSNSIIWKINGLEVATFKGNNIPKEEMYISLNAGLYSDLEFGLPSTMAVDWVRCYSLKK